MIKKQKLELTWIGKDEQPVLEPRILIEDPAKSYGDPRSENMLIHGDNLLALKALEQKFAGKIKCIFIDPPYNTGSAFEHYDDGIEHSLWLSLIRDRLLLLQALLTKDGALWLTLDDNEVHYCKVLCDEIFGRRNFIADVTWEKADSPRMDARYFSSRHDHILVYAKEIDFIRLNRLVDDEAPAHYNKTDATGKIYYLKPLRAMGADGHRAKRPSMYFPVEAPDGELVYPKNPDGTDSRWRWGEERVKKDLQLLEWVKTKSGWSLYFRIYLENSSGRPPETIWFNSDVGSNRTSKIEIKDLFGSDVFDTPKPEALIERVVHLSTHRGDYVLDSFLGSGTTAAVAHKMGRRWIGIELGDHCDTHCLPRLKKVCDGTDQGGISKAVEWKGGGGFKYYDLAPSLLKKDKHGNYVISEDYNADMLAAAMAKQEGFTYAPSQECYWKQGFSTEQDFIFTTTNHVTQAMIDQIAEELAEGEHLLICCKKFSAGCDKRHPSIQVKKIPTMLMGRCEFGKEDYSLTIVNLTDEANAPAFVPQGPKEEPSEKAPARTHGNKNPNQMELF